MGFKDFFNKTNLYFVIIFFTAAIFGFDYNILHGFFPHIAPKKNVSKILNGLLYSEYELVILIIFPIAGKLAPIIGGERVLFIGAAILGIASIFFGLAYLLPAGVPFIVSSFMARAVGSVGAGFGYVVNPALIATLGDSDHVCTLIGTLESVLTGGIIVGPTLGSVLYRYGGYFCPFIFVGCIMLTLSFIIFMVFPNFKSTTIIEGKLSIFISSISFWVNIAALFVINFTVGFQSACFFLYCKDVFNMSPLTSSLAFLGDALAFTAISPFVGMINDYYPHFLPNSICLGLFISGLSMCMMGPLPFLGIQPHIWISVVATIGFGVGDAFVFSPVFTQLLNIALNVGLEDDFKTYSIVSSCHGFFGVLALALGPTIGVLMYKYIGYAYSCGVIALLMLIEIIVVIIVTITGRFFHVEVDSYCKNACCRQASGKMHMHEYRPLLHHPELNPNIKKNLGHGGTKPQLLLQHSHESNGDHAKLLLDQTDSCSGQDPTVPPGYMSNGEV